MKEREREKYQVKIEIDKKQQLLWIRCKKWQRRELPEFDDRTSDRRKITE